MESIKYYSNSGNTYTGPQLDDCHVIELSYTGVSELQPFVGRFYICNGYKLETTFGRKAIECTANYSEILHKQFSRNLITLSYDPVVGDHIHIEIHGTNFADTNYFYQGSNHKFGNDNAGFITIKHL